MHLCIKRGGQTAYPIIAQTLSPVVAAPASPVPAAPAPAAPVSAPAPAASAEPTSASPIVGTFYRSSAPGVEAFVKVGSKVEPDTTVCIIEDKKVMNDIKAEKSGFIKEMLVEYGLPVEYGQPLFVIE